MGGVTTLVVLLYKLKAYNPGLLERMPREWKIIPNCRIHAESYG